MISKRLPQLAAICWLMLGWLGAWQAALAGATNSAWAVRVWQSDDGLANNIVTSLAQTKDGYLWVANPTRLARFDGVQFEEFPTRNLTDGYNQRIVAVAGGRDGSLWLATDRGVAACLKGGVARTFTNHLPELFVESLTEDGEGGLWVKTRGGNTISRIQNGQVTELPMAGSYRSVAADCRGRIWYVRNGEVGVFRNGGLAALAQLGKTGSGRLTGARAGGVWICLGSELFRVEEGKAAVACGQFKTESAAAEPLAMLEDRGGGVWIGTSDSGLFRYDGKNFESVPVSHRQILSLLEDREGNIWVGTGGGGLARIQPRVVRLEGMQSALPFEPVQSLCEDGSGVVWAVTQNGALECRSNGLWRAVSAETNWPGGRAACVAADRSGGVWIGTRSHRLYRLCEGRFKIWQAGDGLVSRNVHVLFLAANGDLWLAGIGPNSIQRMHDGKLETVEIPDGVEIIHALAEDAEGNLWAGSSKGVLLKIRNGLVTDETARTAGGLMSIRTLQTTADGSLWIGYAGGGLGRIKHGRYIRITSAEGLFDDHISQIVADGRGWLWLGSDHGIFKIREQEVDGLAAKPAGRVVSVRYGPDEGLTGLQANYGEAPGVLRDREGGLWLPMRTAVAVINPEALRENSEPPPAVLTQMIVDDRVVARYGAVAAPEKFQSAPALPPDHRHLEFVYTALSFSAPENVRFQYRLQGFDNGWVDAGTERRVSYSRLATGRYQFAVRACNSDGVWSQAGTGVGFVVAPFFWQTWWFWGLAVLGFTSAVAALVRFVSHRQLQLKVAALERQAALDRERTRIARDIHDDIGNLLTQATLLGGLTLRDRAEPEKTAEHAQQISATVEQVTNSLDEIVWAVNPRNDTLPQLIDYVGQFAMEFLQGAGVRCRVDLPDHPPYRAVRADVRHNLFLAVKEALNNVVRHSGAREVALRVAVREEALEVTIQDDGCSFDAGAVDGLGNGLQNMRQRMTELSGTFQIRPAAGGGTQIFLRVPWSRHN